MIDVTLILQQNMLHLRTELLNNREAKLIASDLIIY